jgi:hypothetical protein
LSDYPSVVQVRFRAVAIGSDKGDIAIDNIKITNAHPRRVIYMHTDLLGSPIAETTAEGTKGEQ